MKIQDLEVYKRNIDTFSSVNFLKQLSVDEIELIDFITDCEGEMLITESVYVKVDNSKFAKVTYYADVDEFEVYYILESELMIFDRVRK